MNHKATANPREKQGELGQYLNASSRLHGVINQITISHLATINHVLHHAPKTSLG